MSARVDLVALHAEEYAAARAPRVVPTAPARYLSQDGEGDVSGIDFLEQVRAHSSLLRDLRARARRETGKDFRLPPLEALLGPPRAAGVEVDASGPLPWKILLRIPAFVRTGDLAALCEGDDGVPDGAGSRPARIEELREGRCIQALHVGPLSDLAGTVDRLRWGAADLGLSVRGRLHVMWLSDPARTLPERRRTVIRLPVKPR
jgi:hypothetical protein